MKELILEYRTVEEAIQRGLEELNLSLEDVRIDVLEEGSRGLFGFIGVKQAKVRLTVREEEKSVGTESTPSQSAVVQPLVRQPVVSEPAHSSAAGESESQRAVAPDHPKPFVAQNISSRRSAGKDRPAERRSRPPRRTGEDERVPRRSRETILPLEPGETDIVCAFLAEVAAKMGAKVTLRPSEFEGTLLIDILGDEKGILIGHRGETLDALQYLAGLVHNKNRVNYRRVQLDSQNYRRKREETLIRLAGRLAEKARKSGRRVTLEPMNPYERRILHSALQDNPYVTTHSEGDEPNRRVVILPK